MNNLIHIFYIKQTEKLSNEIFQQFLLQLPDSFQQDINAYKHWQSAQASLLGKQLLQYGIHQLKLSHSLQDILIGEKDRPFINNEIDFNISHSGDYVIVAISDFSKVGIDIEMHRTLDINLFRKYFDENEWNEIQSSVNSLQSFFDMWSIKESAIKCDGRGVEVLSKTHKQLSNQINCDSNTFYYQQIDIVEKYSCCVCSNKQFITKITALHLSDFL